MEQEFHIKESRFSGVVFGLIALMAVSALVGNLVSRGTQESSSIGTGVTRNQSSLSYVDGNDLYQNVQAIAEKMANQSQYEVLQADSQGEMQAVDTIQNLRGSSFVQSGAIATFTVTSTATAANVCDNPLWIVTPVSTTPTLTGPSSSTLFADCLTVNGDSKTVRFLTLNTSTILAAGTGGTALFESSLTVAANKAATLEFVRDTSTTYKIFVVNMDN